MEKPIFFFSKLVLMVIVGVARIYILEMDDNKETDKLFIILHVIINEVNVYRIINKKHMDISVLYVNMQRSHFNIIISHFNIIISHVTCCSLHLWRQIRQTWKAERMVKSKSTWWYMYIVKHFKNWLFRPEIALLFFGKFCGKDQGTVLSKLKVYQ